MSLIFCYELTDGRETDLDVQTDKFPRRYTRVWKARTSVKSWDGTQVIAAGILGGYLPAISSYYPQDEYAWLHRYNASDAGPEGYDWIVTAYYSNRHEVWSNPLAEPAVYDWDMSPSQGIAIKHRAGPNEGKVILNTNSELFVPPVPVDTSVWAVTIRKNVPMVPVWISQVNQPINNDAIVLGGRPIPIRCARLNSIGIPNPQRRNSIVYYPMSLRLVFDWNTWLHKEPARAFNHLDPDKDDKLSKIVLPAPGGGFPEDPYPLDEDGVMLSDADRKDPTKWHFVDVYKYPEIAFASLPLW